MPKTHQMTGTPEYITWAKIVNRCCNKNAINYERYGGRGIAMCDEWRNSFEAFYRDMGGKPSKEYSIERKNNSLGYCPSNCVWADRITQGSNKRNNVNIVLLGVRKTLSEWCRDLSLNYDITRQRITRDGWSAEKAILQQPKHL